MTENSFPFNMNLPRGASHLASLVKSVQRPARSFNRNEESFEAVELNILFAGRSQTTKGNQPWPEQSAPQEPNN